MNKLLLIGFALATGFLGQSEIANAQSSDTKLTAEDVGVTPGMPLPSGLGYFANPDNYHNLTLGVQAGLGVSEKSATFGYDNLAVSTKFKLGDNKFGKRLALLAGFSDWRTPAYRKVFAAPAIDSLPDQDRFAAQSANSATVGLSLTFGREKIDKPFDEESRKKLNEIDAFLDSDVIPGAPLTSVQRNTLLQHSTPLITAADITRYQTDGATTSERRALLSKFRPTLVDSLIAKPISPQQKAEREKERRQVVLQAFRKAQRDLEKGWSFSTGFLGRITAFAETSDVQAYDLFATLAKGVKGVDIVGAAHYLYYLDNSLPKWAQTAAVGAFANLSDNGPTPVIGLTVGYGYYTFNELHDVIAEAPKTDLNPATGRFDALLSYSGAPDKANQSAAGLGIRYSRVSPSLLPDYNVFSLVFSTNFILVK